MPKLLRARAPQNAEEEYKIRKLTRSRHAPADWIARARIISLSWQGLRTARIAEELGCAIHKPSEGASTASIPKG